MARLFDDVAEEYCQIDQAPVTAAPFTLACWMRTNDDTTSQNAMWLGDKDVTNRFWGLGPRGNVANDPVRFFGFGATTGTADTTAGFTANQWHHICGVEAASNDRRVYLDGANKGTNATGVTITGADRIAVGRSGDSSPGDYFSGDIAHAAVWNVALNDEEVAELAAGACPNTIHPGNLVAYWDGDLTDDKVGVFDLTAVGGAESTDPPAGPAGCFSGGRNSIGGGQGGRGGVPARRGNSPPGQLRGGIVGSPRRRGLIRLFFTAGRS